LNTKQDKLRNFFRLKVDLWGLLAVAGWLACVLTATAFLGRFWWGFDLTSHFRVQYAGGLLMLALVFCGARRWKTALLFIGFAAVNCTIVVPYCYFGGAPTSSAKQTLRILVLNVHTENRQFQSVEAFIRELNPDLIVLEEINEECLRNLAGLQAAYPHGEQEPREDNFGIALFSKAPLEKSEIVYIGQADVPSVTATIQVAGKSLRILGTHPLPPSGGENSRLRNQQLESIPAFLAAGRAPAVIVGDLNATPWSAHFQKLVRDTGLIDSGRGRGLQTTWPADMFPLRIGIDHCLVSPDLKVVSRKVGRNVGSDHLPLVVEIAVE
jgi:endonuclease/exonuclease/phosphatase (EEP) superfamily protein YafD